MPQLRVIGKASTLPTDNKCQCRDFDLPSKRASSATRDAARIAPLSDLSWQPESCRATAAAVQAGDFWSVVATNGQQSAASMFQAVFWMRLACLSSLVL
jgi:hypothetical protein